MKKFKRMLAGLACVLAVCLCTPTAFAAKVIVYFDANGGICTSAAERTNADGQLTSLPTATMEGYTFDGWYTTGTDDVPVFPLMCRSKPTIRRLVRIPPSMPTGRPMAAVRKWWRRKR